MKPDELLERMAVTLRQQIGPEVGDPFAKTQAFMAAVILEKLSGQVRLADEHARADAADRATLVADLETEDLSPALAAAVVAVRAEGDSALSGLVEALYADRSALGADRFDALLTRVRKTLRARLDRQLAYAS